MCATHPALTEKVAWAVPEYTFLSESLPVRLTLPGFLILHGGRLLMEVVFADEDCAEVALLHLRQQRDSEQTRLVHKRRRGACMVQEATPRPDICAR